MSGFLNPLQSAIFTRLSAALAPLAVYDDPPNQPDGLPLDGFPYILIGDDTAISWDTDTSLGASATITLHVWSRYAGKKEAKTILGQIYTALHRGAANLSASGYAFIDCLLEFSEVVDEIDGKTRHGIARYRVYMEKTS